MTCLNAIDLNSVNLESIAEEISSASPESKAHVLAKLEKAKELSNDGYIVSIEHSVYIPNNNYKEYVVDVYATDGNEEIAIEVGRITKVKTEWLLMVLDKVINVHPDNMDTITMEGDTVSNLKSYFQVSGLKDKADTLEEHIKNTKAKKVDVQDFEDSDKIRYIIETLAEEHNLFIKINETEYKVDTDIYEPLSAGNDFEEEENDLLRKVRSLDALNYST